MEKDYSKIRFVVGRNIVHIREMQKMTQLDLVKKTGFPQTSLSQWENGKREISLQYLYMLADILHVPISSFFPELDSDDPKLSAAIRKLGTLPPKKRKIIYDLIDAMQE